MKPDGVVDYNGIGLSYGSPDIRYTTFWWVDISGVPDSYLHNDVSYSYGYGNGFALRTRTTPSSTLRIMSARVVPPTTEASPTLAMSRIPTAFSPYTGFSIDFVDAWQVSPSGVIVNLASGSVVGSYGSKNRRVQNYTTCNIHT